MTGRILAAFLVITAIVAGIAMYWLQVYAYYEEVESPEIRLTTLSGVAEPILADDVEAIDAGSSPIRYRACFTTPMSQAMLTETYEVYDDAVPLVAPGWFDCFDATAIGEALEEGRAIAFLGEANVEYGIDRIVAIDANGRGYAWHQINECGEVVFDGKPAPEGCPPPPASD